MTDMPTDIYRAALDTALTTLRRQITDAQQALHDIRYPCAVIGALCTFDAEVEDVRAALRLYTNATRQPWGST